VRRAEEGQRLPEDEQEDEEDGDGDGDAAGGDDDGGKPVDELDAGDPRRGFLDALPHTQRDGHGGGGGGHERAVSSRW